MKSWVSFPYPLHTIIIYVHYNYFVNLPDGISSSHSNPLWNRTILLQLFGQFGLNTESLVCRLERSQSIRYCSVLLFMDGACVPSLCYEMKNQNEELTMVDPVNLMFNRKRKKDRLSTKKKKIKQFMAVTQPINTLQCYACSLWKYEKRCKSVLFVLKYF